MLNSIKIKSRFLNNLNKKHIFTDKDAKFYKENGYVIIQNMFSTALMDELKEEIEKIIDNIKNDNSNKDNSKDYNLLLKFFNIKAKFDPLVLNSDKYYLESGDKLRLFLEKDNKAINKIGHGNIFVILSLKIILNLRNSRCQRKIQRILLLSRF